MSDIVDFSEFACLFDCEEMEFVGYRVRTPADMLQPDEPIIVEEDK